jgi:hypothetical protein
MNLKEKLISGVAVHPKLVTLGISIAITTLVTALLTVGLMDESMVQAIKQTNIGSGDSTN